MDNIMIFYILCGGYDNFLKVFFDRIYFDIYFGLNTVLGNENILVQVININRIVFYMGFVFSLKGRENLK